MSDELRSEVAIWRRYALEDLKQAERLLESREAVPRHPAWLAQQAAEKALKAVLIWLQINFPYTHDLDAIFRLIPEDWVVKNVEADFYRLSEYAVDTRYPGNWPDLSHDDAEKAVIDARRVVDAVEEDFKQR